MTDLSSPATAPFIDGLNRLSGRYDVALCDVWGVVHNGRASFPAACDALTRFRQGGGAVVLITNAPRPNGPIRAQLDHLHVPRSAYDAVVTSGDVTIGLMRARGGPPVHHIGPSRDLSLFDSLVELGGPAPPRTSLEEASYVLCTGLFDDTRETPADYEGTIADMLARKLLMICANPDLVIHRGEDLIYCAGALAERYERIGGEVVYAGKPHPPIYHEALARADAIRGKLTEKSRVVAIGDAMRTDIAGAHGQGLDTLFVASGIHRDEIGGGRAIDTAAFEQFAARHGVRPTAIIDHLVW
jgi:HAD superfamily hydrolase (TIGR01459 family)